MIKKIIGFFILTLFSILSFAQYPSDFKLSDLESKLYEKPSCINLSCSTLNKIVIKDFNNETKKMKISFFVSARMDSVVNIPIKKANIDIDYIKLNSKPWFATFVDSQNNISMGVLKGINEVEMEFKLNSNNLEFFNFDKVFINEAKGIKVIPSEQSILLQIQGHDKNNEDTKITTKYNTQPIVIVDRTLVMSEKWQLITKVYLLDNSSNNSYNIKVSKFANEKPISSDIQFDGANFDLNLSNQPIVWSSIVEPSEVLNFKGSNNYLEKLSINTSSNWLLSFEGLNPVEKGSNPNFSSSYSWLFWPSDNLKLKIAKPKAIIGDTSAIQNYTVDLNTSIQPNQYTFTLKLKSSLADKIKIDIPDNLKLSSVVLNNQSLPFDNNKNMTVDILAGSNTITILLDKTSDSFEFIEKLPKLGISVKSLNHSYNVEIPTDKWILWAYDTDIHPSILLWSVLIVCVLGAVILSRIINSPLGFYSWMFLLFGFSQSGLLSIAIVIGWFVILSLRARDDYINHMYGTKTFNFFQLVIALMTIFVFSITISTVSTGLLSYPNLFVEGLNSYDRSLHWYSEQFSNFNPTIISLPIWVYRVLMFTWSMWFAFNIINWLKWAWESFSKVGLWSSKIKLPKSIIQEKVDF